MPAKAKAKAKAGAVVGMRPRQRHLRMAAANRLHKLGRTVVRKWRP